MKEIPARPITTQEGEVLNLALTRGALAPVPDSALADVPSLKVGASAAAVVGASTLPASLVKTSASQIHGVAPRMANRLTLWFGVLTGM
jgi:hypothetical protein